MAIPLLAVMAIAGLAKGLLVDKPKENRDRQLASENIRYSGFRRNGELGSGVGIEEAKPVDDAMQFGFAGLAQDNEMAKAKRGEAFTQQGLDNQRLELLSKNQNNQLMAQILQNQMSGNQTSGLQLKR